jgi:nucleotide-binding universal stress UspA family protein
MRPVNGLLFADQEAKSMWLEKTILVATDFGELSETLCQVGLELAQRFHVPLVILHTCAPPSPVYSGVQVLAAEEHRALVENAARVLLDREAEPLRGRGVDVSTILRVGDPADEILQAARDLDFGLIVVGTHGRRGLPHALIGSVAEKVVRRSPVPVLTVHEAGTPIRETES